MHRKSTSFTTGSLIEKLELVVKSLKVITTVSLLGGTGIKLAVMLSL